MGKALNDIIQVIKDFTAGNYVAHPWTGKTIIWRIDESGNYTYKEYCIEPDQFDEFCKFMGGQHVLFSPAPTCEPLNYNPETKFLDAPIQWVKEVLSDIIHPKAVLTSDNNQLNSVQIQEPVCDIAIAGFEPSEELLELQQKCRDINFQL